MVELKRTQLNRSGALTRRGILRGRPIRVRGVRSRTPWQSIRGDVYARGEGRCDRCRGSLAGGYECHHRLLRSGGGPDTLENLCALCLPCHRWAHANPDLARRTGFIVASWANPATTPVLRHGHAWQLPGVGWRYAPPQPWQELPAVCAPVDEEQRPC